jgi:hypothetical protein
MSHVSTATQQGIKALQDSLYNSLNTFSKDRQGIAYMGCKLISVPLALEDTLLDTLITPFSAVESVARAALNLVGSLFSFTETCKDYSVKRAIHYSEKALSDVTSSVVGLATALPKLAYQLLHIAYDAHSAKPIEHVRTKMLKNSSFTSIKDFQKSLYTDLKAKEAQENAAKDEVKRIQALFDEANELVKQVNERANEIKKIKQNEYLTAKLPESDSLVNTPKKAPQSTTNQIQITTLNRAIKAFNANIITLTNAAPGKKGGYSLAITSLVQETLDNATAITKDSITQALQKLTKERNDAQIELQKLEDEHKAGDDETFNLAHLSSRTSFSTAGRPSIADELLKASTEQEKLELQGTADVNRLKTELTAAEANLKGITQPHSLQIVGRITAPFIALADTLADTFAHPMKAIDHLARAVLNVLGCLFVKGYSMRNALGHAELSLRFVGSTIPAVVAAPVKFVYQTLAIMYNPKMAQTIHHV